MKRTIIAASFACLLGAQVANAVQKAAPEPNGSTTAQELEDCLIKEQKLTAYKDGDAANAFDFVVIASDPDSVSWEWKATHRGKKNGVREAVSECMTSFGAKEKQQQ